MNILVTNDDGIQAKGIRVLADIMRQFGQVTVIAPKTPQSGMSMAVSLGGRTLAYKELHREDGLSLAYLDATPASCVKFALNMIFTGDNRPDVVVSGINHGSNAASAACYSGTLGAVTEAALNGIPGIGVSVHTTDPDADFSHVLRLFPDIFRKLMENPGPGYGTYYNINFPEKDEVRIKGVKTACQGSGRWVKEFVSLGDGQDGEKLFSMTGEFIDDVRNTDMADHRLLRKGYVTIVPHKIDCTDYAEYERLGKIVF